MIARVLSALTGWRGYAAAGVLGAVLGGAATGGIQQIRVSARDDSLAATRLERDTLREINGQCAADVQTAADGWAEYRRQAAGREAAARAAAVEAAGRARIADGRAAELAKRPPAGADQCTAVDDLLADYMQGRR